MPWCDDCSRFWNPNSMPADGRCPTCGAVLAASAFAPARTDPPDQEYRAPWHFWLLVVAAVVYLGWRLVQGIGWLVG